MLDERTIKKVDPERLLGKVISVTFNESAAPLNSFLVVDFRKLDLSIDVPTHEEFEELTLKHSHSSKYVEARLHALGTMNDHLQLIDVITSKPYDCFSNMSGFLIVEGWMVENGSQFSNRFWVPNFYVVCEENML